MQDIWVQSVGGEDPLEEEMATHSIILAWRIPWTVEPGRLQSIGLQTQLKRLCTSTNHNYIPIDSELKKQEHSLLSKMNHSHIIGK